ncbi:MAG TPA: tRNA pseudouridine(55) synthase TruB [Oscillatoriales cyanobacterium M59_W2019_021]|nr:MAG: tRNA pseudouridine(55) synthase TruB [Cyanobacteria bacterium J055]HIK32944.1 tRNA pseudouridine(55) synthase TruB [Oscillatoriales cyanobacterium M4454_W2019_049]HIK52590.1 tRNA pseudouridine(55) synthase TruB [Oscillatoriales cyanobacterium M59_W2019_021]
MHGFLNLNKPFGFTSHDCVAKVRRLLRLKKVGHGGTLDPAATGVLPIAVGKATRLLQYLRHDKAYFATVRLGVRTTTDDLEGEIIESQPVSGLDLATVKEALDRFRGTIRQIPPKYSAIQVGGRRLYDLARSGVEVEVPERTVEVYSIEVLDWRDGKFPEVDLQIVCGGGTYIRAIARDLGSALQTGGTLAKLIRTHSSGFSRSDSLTLEQLADKMEMGTFQLIPPSAVLQHLIPISLADADVRRWCQGQKIADLPCDLASKPADAIRRVQDEDGRFLGIGTWVESAQLLVPKLVAIDGDLK